MTAQELIQLLEASPGDREAILSRAKHEASTEVLKEAADHFLRSGNASLGASLSSLVNEDWKDSKVAEEEAAVQSQVTDRASELEASGVSRFEAQDRARAEAGVDEGGPTDPFANQEFFLPEEIVRAIGQDAPSKEAAQEALDRVNDMFPGRTFETWDDALAAGVIEDPTTKAVVSLVVEDTNPEDYNGLILNRRDGSEYTINGGIADTAMAQFGLTDEELIKNVKMAEIYGFETAAGQIAWQPFIAIAEANGFAYGDVEKRNRQNGEDLAKQQDLKELIARLEGQARQGPGGVPGAVQELNDARRQLAAVEARLDRGIDPNRVLTPRQIAADWKRGMELYDNETLAFFHTLDAGLAKRMSTNDVLSLDDARMSLSLMAKAGLDGDNPEDFAQNMAALGFLDPFADQLIEAQKAAASAGSGRQVLQPDPVAIRQSAKDLYKQLYLTDPSEAQLDVMASQITASISSAPEDVSVSGDARVRSVVEGQPLYQEFYGNMPGGMTEEEYQGMHRAAQGSMLGAELAGNQAVKVGMRQGDYQTTVGASMGTKEAWDNSTFLGRLAKAGQVIGQNT